ncbi:MAG: hypothetical protein JO079_00105 [Frankiaceae bacterium]|nr:hypothetical protein [Frankiaceae bacterium]
MSRTRLAVAALAAGILAAAVVPANAKTGARTFTLKYEGVASVQSVISGTADGQGQHLGYVELPTSRKDHTVSVVVTDDHGSAVAFQLSQGDRSDTATMTDIGEWCSSTPHPVKLPHPGQPVVVYVEVGACGNSPSTPTTGTVKLTVR